MKKLKCPNNWHFHLGIVHFNIPVLLFENKHVCGPLIRARYTITSSLIEKHTNPKKCRCGFCCIKKQLTVLRILVSNRYNRCNLGGKKKHVAGHDPQKVLFTLYRAANQPCVFESQVYFCCDNVRCMKPYYTNFLNLRCYLYCYVTTWLTSWI